MKKSFLLFIIISLALIFVILLSGCNAVEPRINLADVTEIELIILESFPVQVMVVAKGYLPNPCTQINKIIQNREGNSFFITIKTQSSQEACIQVLTTFEERIPLMVYGLSEGTYTVNVNGIKDTFTLEMDNIYQAIK
jgi:inhibitor of cysteine peptidase